MQKLTNSALIFLSAFLILILSGCKDKPPVIERCIIGHDEDRSTCICLNPEIESEPRIEDIDYCENFISTSPDNYRIIETWVVDKLKELEQCQSKHY